MKKKIIICLAYWLTWVIVEKVVEVLCNDSPARVAYGVLSAWWATLYLSRVIKINFNSILILVLLGIPFLIYIYPIGHDREFDIISILISFIILLSPFLINLFVNFIENIFCNYKQKKLLHKDLSESK